MSSHSLRKYLPGIILIVISVIGSYWAIKNLRPSGRMTVIEAQAMDMTTMKPQVGSVAVATQIVKKKPFTTVLRYTGLVVPFSELNIASRIEGQVTGLKVGNGDRVRSGQLLAVLDAPEVGRKLDEAKYSHAAALLEEPVAKSNLSRVQAEMDAYQTEHRIATHELAAAKEKLASNRIILANLENSVNQKGTTSVDNASLHVAQSNVELAAADVEKKQNILSISTDRVCAARAAVATAKGDINRKRALSKLAGAVEQTAAAIDSFRSLRAPFDGVVIERFVSPGALVDRNTPILSIAQIDRIRVRVSIPELDLNGIEIGSRLSVRPMKTSRKAVFTTISSISRSADEMTQSVTVEALIDNKDHFLLPGNYENIEIPIARNTPLISVPLNAVTSEGSAQYVWIVVADTSHEVEKYVCPMHPEVVEPNPGICPKCNMALQKQSIHTGKIARKVFVTTGRSDDKRIEVLSGLREGDEVIHAGYRYLHDGDSVLIAKPKAKNDK